MYFTFLERSYQYLFGVRRPREYKCDWSMKFSFEKLCFNRTYVVRGLTVFSLVDGVKTTQRHFISSSSVQIDSICTNWKKWPLWQSMFVTNGRKWVARRLEKEASKLGMLNVDKQRLTRSKMTVHLHPIWRTWPSRRWWARPGWRQPSQNPFRLVSRDQELLYNGRRTGPFSFQILYH